MAEKTSETTRESGDCAREGWGTTIAIKRGVLITRCPGCSFDTFGLRNPRFASPEQAASERARTREN